MNRMSPKHWLLLLLLAILLMPMTAVQAQGIIQGDKIIFGSSFVLRSGETLKGDLVVVGGTATVEENSRVIGDLAVIGGSAQVNGTIEGDLAVLGGALDLGPTAVIKGDAATLGGTLRKAPGAIIEGDVRSDFQFKDGGEITVPGLPPIETAPSRRPGFGGFLLTYFLRGVSAIAWAAMLSVLGVLAIMFIPRHVERVAETSAALPARSFGVGCLSLIIAVPLLAFLIITICLAPLAAILGAGLMLAWLFGWLSLGWRLGQYLVTALNVEKSTPVIEAIIGIALLTLIWRMPLALPFVGWLIFWTVGLVAGAVGLGSVLLTRFGAQPYPNHGRATTVSLDLPPAPPSPPTTPSADEEAD